VVLTCLPEELPVTETLEGLAALHEAGLPVAAVVANRVTGDRLGGRAGPAGPPWPGDPGRRWPRRRRGRGPSWTGPLWAPWSRRPRPPARGLPASAACSRRLAAGLDGLPMFELLFLAGGAGGTPGGPRLAGLLVQGHRGSAP
jgi:hypothetical protein